MKKKLKTKKLIIYIFIIICIIGLGYSIFNIIKWKLENKQTQKLQEIIKENIIIEEPINEKKSILDNYSIDFNELKKINSEVVGYIKVENTNIDSTILKHGDNNFYLTHSFDKTLNSAGWVFSHYLNKYDGSDRHYVLFGHARLDGSMFGTLKNVLSNDWQNGKIIFITENDKNLFEIFSVYKIPVEDYYITTKFNTDKEFQTFIEIMKSRSFKDFNVPVTTNDTLLTLSTCDIDDKYRIVLHAKKLKEDIDF